MNLNDALKYGTGYVPKRDAIFILQNVSGYTHEDILINGGMVLSGHAIIEYKSKIKRLVNGEPLQYVLGKWDFMGLEFITDRRALIPRPETELLVEAVLEHIANKHCLDILDVCTGSGCIGLSIAQLANFRHNITLADVSQDALELAAENLSAIKKHHSASINNVKIVKSNLLQDVPGTYDIIVSNPPYILTGEMQTLPENVKNHEPHLALDGGKDGLDIYRALIPQSYEKLNQNGMLFLEIGSSGTKELMQQAGFCKIKIIKDYAGHNRILMGAKKNV